MKPSSRLSRAADLVEAFEAFEPRAVRRPEGGWMIGYGHTASAREGAIVTADDASALLLYDLGRVAETIETSVFAPLNANQFEALAAFAFNIGADNFLRSTALRRLNAGDAHGAAREIERWRRAELSGEAQVVDVLIRRRAAEKALFLTPPEGFPKAATPSLRPAFDPEPLGDWAAAEVEPDLEPASATLAAADGVAARLRALVPEPTPEAEPGPDTEPTERSADDADKSVEHDALTCLDPEESPDPFLNDHEAVDSTIEEDAPPPPPFVDELVSEPFAPPEPANEAAETVFHASPVAERRWQAGPVLPKAPTRPSPRIRATALLSRLLRSRRLRRGVVFALGVVGVMLFTAAVGLILSRRPGGLHLVLGLLGIAALTPATYLLLGGGRSKST